MSIDQPLELFLRDLQTQACQAILDIQLSNGILRVVDWAGLGEVGDFDELYLHQNV